MHFERNVLSSVSSSSRGDVAEAFVEMYGGCSAKAVFSVLEVDTEDALTYVGYPASHHRIRTTNILLHSSEEENVRGVGLRGERVHDGYGDSLEEQWALKRYLTMDAFKEVEEGPQLLRH